MKDTVTKLDEFRKMEELGGLKRETKPKKAKGDEDVIFVKMDRAVVRQFKMLSAETGRSQKRLIATALNMLFKTHGKPQIADEGAGE